MEKKEVVVAPSPPTVDELRQRITGEGWEIKEFPKRNGEQIGSWRIILVKPSRTISYDGPTLEASLTAVGKMVGVVRG